MAEKKMISVIAPAYNEEDCVQELARRLKKVFEENSSYDFEVILVENGSTDQTWQLLQEIHSEDSRFKIVQLSRNFRMDGGITAGLEYASGDAAVIMAADLQDPPELITSFIAKWEEGYENIYMVVARRNSTRLIRRVNSTVFYWLAEKLTNDRFPRNASDFRMVDRKVYEAVRVMDERNRFVRGLFGWVGFRSIGIRHERSSRHGGESKARFFDVLDLAIKGIFAHSYLPLRLISIAGFALFILSLISLILFTTFWIFVGVPFAGFGTLAALSVLAIGLPSLMLSVISQYLALVYEEVKRRPNFVVSRVLDQRDP